MREHATLVKFGQHEHISQLQDEGLLYLNSLPYFWEIEDQELRGDPFDGVDEVARGHKGTVTLANGADTPIEVANWTMRIHPPEPERINIFCMYALRPSVGSFPVDERNLRFGDYVLLLTNPQQFIDRIASSLNTQAIRCKAGLIEYVDEGHTGEVGPFRKLKRFAYQSEWRLVCNDGPGEARKIWIGSIRDISTIMPSNELNQRITISS